MAKMIVVIEAGWVVVGEVQRVWVDKDGREVPANDPSVVRQDVRIDDAAVIREWGTTAGLGQLALEGPRSGSTFDPCARVLVNPDKILFTIDWVSSRWWNGK